MLYFLYYSSKARATPRKKPNDSHGVATPRLKTSGLSESRKRKKQFFVEC